MGATRSGPYQIALESINLTRGNVRRRGRSFLKVPPSRRPVGYRFSGSLFPVLGLWVGLAGGCRTSCG